MIIGAKRHGFPGTGESDGGIRAFCEKKSRGETVFIKLNADDMTTVILKCCANQLSTPLPAAYHAAHKASDIR
jgi:hypothetical protein